MLKRYLALLLCVLMLPCASLAEGGILPVLPATDALSFGQATGTEPAMAFLLTDGWYEAYLNVTAEQYYAFSAALAESDFVLAESTVEQQYVTARVRRRDAEMFIRYSLASGLLTVEYALGRPVTPETIPNPETFDAFVNGMFAAQAGIHPADMTPEMLEDFERLRHNILTWLLQSIQQLSPESRTEFEQLVNACAEYF